jgi:hypothetical protein
VTDAAHTATSSAASADAVVRRVLASTELAWEEPSPGRFVVELPGTRKLTTTCSLVVGAHALSVNAFVARRPDENHEAVYRWLLERNTKAYAVAFAVDHLGDIYLTGRVSLESVTPDEVDRLLGAVLEYADGSFNRILEMGFETAIKREWEWRRHRGESTANLAAFAHLAEPDD